MQCHGIPHLIQLHISQEQHQDHVPLEMRPPTLVYVGRSPIKLKHNPKFIVRVARFSNSSQRKM